MIKARLLVYGLEDSDNFYTDFYFDVSQVQAVFMANELQISLVIGGQIYEVEYQLEILNSVKKALDLRNSYNLN